MKILIVDDEPDLLALVALVIENHFKIPIVQAHSKNEAIAALSSGETFTGILSDFHLLDGTALDLVEFMKSQNLTIPLIICTGAPLESNSLGHTTSPIEYLPKPFTKGQIMAKVQSTFKLEKKTT